MGFNGAKGRGCMVAILQPETLVYGIESNVDRVSYVEFDEETAVL